MVADIPVMGTTSGKPDVGVLTGPAAAAACDSTGTGNTALERRLAVKLKSCLSLKKKLAA